MPHRFLAGVVLIALIAGCATTAAGPQAPLEDGTQTEQAPLSQ
jgi:hypothetical protein